MPRSTPLHKPEYSHDFAKHSRTSLEALFDMLYEVDMQIAKCATLLNKSQPLLSGKVEINFGITQRHKSGLALVEPYRARLYQQKSRAGSKWVVRRLSASILKHRGGKTENLLCNSFGHDYGGIIKKLPLENKKISVAACRSLDRLFEHRSEIKKAISALNASFAYLNRSQKSLTQKTDEVLAKGEKELEVDFSNPDLAYRLIAQKRLKR